MKHDTAAAPQPRLVNGATLTGAILLAVVLGMGVAGVAYVSQNRESPGVRMADAARKWLNSLSAEQKGWVQAAGNEISAKEPAKAFDLERSAAEKLKKMGVKVVDNVDKNSFAAVADPYLDKLAKELGPHAEKIKNLIRAVD